MNSPVTRSETGIWGLGVGTWGLGVGTWDLGLGDMGREDVGTRGLGDL